MAYKQDAERLVISSHFMQRTKSKNVQHFMELYPSDLTNLIKGTLYSYKLSLQIERETTYIHIIIYQSKAADKECWRCLAELIRSGVLTN